MKEKTITLDQLVRWVGAGLLVLGILLLVNYLSSVLLPFVIAWFFAYLLYPMVKFVQYKMHVKSRALSIVLTLIVVVAVVAGIIYLIIPPMIEQFEKLGSLVTAYIQKEAHIRDIPSAIQDWINQNNREIEKFFKSSTFTDSIKTVLPGLFIRLSLVSWRRSSPYYICSSSCWITSILLRTGFVSSPRRVAPSGEDWPRMVRRR